MSLRRARSVVSLLTSCARTAEGFQAPLELCSTSGFRLPEQPSRSAHFGPHLWSSHSQQQPPKRQAHWNDDSWTPSSFSSRGLTSTCSAAARFNLDRSETGRHPQHSPQPPAQGGLLGRLPASLVPYAQLMRLDKPTGTWLLLWPGLWSIALAAPAGSLPDLSLLALFSVGAVLLRGAGCTVNDMWDRDFDRRVERTKQRPLASGALGMGQATGLLAGQLSLGLMILLQLNTYSQVLGASSLLLVGTYPLMKRITNWPQAYLGLTINWGALLGWAAVRGECDWSVVLPLYAAGAAWTLLYDTIYAHQDVRDDVAAGVRSTALLFGGRTKAWLFGFGAAHVACLALAGSAVGAGPVFHVGVLAASAHLAWQTSTVRLDVPADCMRKFVSNQQYGALVFAAIVADRALALAL